MPLHTHNVIAVDPRDLRDALAAADRAALHLPYVGTGRDDFAAAFDALRRMAAALDQPVYAVGDEDPTLIPSPTAIGCRATTGDGRYSCTWPTSGHEHPQHVAGTGAEIVAVWTAEESD
jgi:hypothetical protein